MKLKDKIIIVILKHISASLAKKVVKTENIIDDAVVRELDILITLLEAR